MPRQVIVHVFRHGKATGGEKNAELTPEGVEQARKAGWKLLKFLPKKAIIKFYNSPIRRAQQTRKLIEAIVREKRPALEARERYTLAYLKPLAGGVLAEKAKAEAMKDYRKTLIEFPKRLSERTSGRRSIHLIVVSHAGPPALTGFLEQLTGKPIEKLGGNLENCERFTLEFKPRKEPVLRFREHKMRVH